MMEFQYEPELQAYMQKHGQKTILVELVEINTSDLELMELHVRFANSHIRNLFLTKKNYRCVETQCGEVLLPRYPLKISDTVTFGLKSILFFKHIKYSGIQI